MYRQLADLLRTQIVDGTFGPGDKLPAEYRIAQEHGVSRETVRSALVELRAEGLVESIKGRGTRVRLAVSREQFSLQRGSVITMRMPTPDERRSHGIGAGIPVADIRYGAKTFLLIADRHEMIVK